MAVICATAASLFCLADTVITELLDLLKDSLLLQLQLQLLCVRREQRLLPLLTTTVSMLSSKNRAKICKIPIACALQTCDTGWLGSLFFLRNTLWRMNNIRMLLLSLWKRLSPLWFECPRFESPANFSIAFWNHTFFPPNLSLLNVGGNIQKGSK